MRRVVGWSRRVGLAHRCEVLLGLPARTSLTCIFDRDSLRRPTERDQQPIRVERLAILERPVILLSEQLIGLFAASKCHKTIIVA